MRFKTPTVRDLLGWLYGDPHGIGISVRLATEKFGGKVVEEADRLHLTKTKDGVIKISPDGLRSLVRR